MGEKRKSYNNEFRMEVLSYYYSHDANLLKTSERFGLPRTTLLGWMKKYAIDKNCVSLHHPKTRMALHYPLSSMACQANQYDLSRSLV